MQYIVVTQNRIKKTADKIVSGLKYYGVHLP